MDGQRATREGSTQVESAVNSPNPVQRKPPNAGKGRKKGTPNKATSDVRTMIAVVAERNAAKVEGWLTRIGRKNPGKALDLYLRMIEYHIPKLSRQEVVSDDKPNGRVIDSSQLTAEQREQLRQMILGQPELLEQQPANVLEPVGQVIESE
jgi:hypothetical protein